MKAITVQHIAHARSANALFDRLKRYGGPSDELRDAVHALPESIKRDFVLTLAQQKTSYGNLRRTVQEMANYYARYPYNSDDFALNEDALRGRERHIALSLSLPHHERYDGNKHPLLHTLDVCLRDLDGEIKIPLQGQRRKMPASRWSGGSWGQSISAAVDGDALKEALFGSRSETAGRG